jgi:glutaredoxin
LIQIYTRNNPPCTYCEAAKTLLKTKNIQHETIVVGEDITKEQLRELFPNALSFPVVVENNKFIGGFTELKTNLLSRDLGGMTI